MVATHPQNTLAQILDIDGDCFVSSGSRVLHPSLTIEQNGLRHMDAIFQHKRIHGGQIDWRFVGTMCGIPLVLIVGLISLIYLASKLWNSGGGGFFGAAAGVGIFAVAVLFMGRFLFGYFRLSPRVFA